MQNLEGISYSVDFTFDASGVLKALKNIKKAVDEIGKSMDKINFQSRFSGMSSSFDNIRQATEAIRQQRDEFERLQSTLQRSENSASVNSQFNVFDGIGEKVNSKISGAIRSTLASSWKEALSQFTDTDFELRSATAKSSKDLKDMYSTLQKYDQLAKKVGGATVFNNFDIAEGINAAAALGVAKDKMDSFIESSAQFAQAHKMNLASAISISKKALNTFNIDLSRSSEVLDIITSISNNSSASVRSLGLAFSYVGSTAYSLKRSVPQVASLIGALNNSGFDGTRAGTALDSIYKSLNNFQKRTKIEEIVGPITDAMGDLIPEKEIILKLQKAKANVSSVDFSSVMSDIFGDVGGRGMMALVNTNIKELERLEKVAYNSAGATANSAAFMMEGIGGKAETLTGNLSSMFSTFISTVEPLITPFIKSFTVLSDAVGDLLSKNPQLVKFAFSVTLLAGARVKVLSLYDAFKKLKEADGVLGILKNSMASISTGLGLMALAGVLVVLKNRFDAFMNVVRSNQETSRSFDNTMNKLKDTVLKLFTVTGDFVLALFGIDVGTKKSVEGFNNLSSEASTSAKEIERVKKVLIIASENLDKVQQALDNLQKWVSDNKSWLKTVGYIILIAKAFSTITSVVKPVIDIVFLLGSTVAGVSVGVIAGAVLAIAGVFIFLYSKFEGFRNFVNAVPDWIAGVFNIISNLPLILWQGLVSVVTSSFNFVKDMIVGIVDFSIKAILSVVDLLKGDFSSAASRFSQKTYKPYANNENYNIIDQIVKHHSQGTDFLRNGRNYTTTDEHGHEAIWLPTGSMIAKNSTTQKMSDNLNEIRKSKGESSENTKIINHITINVRGTEPREIANEAVSQIKLLGGY